MYISPFLPTVIIFTLEFTLKICTTTTNSILITFAIFVAAVDGLVERALSTETPLEAE
jgi:hypothetical protein